VQPKKRKARLPKSAATTLSVACRSSVCVSACLLTGRALSSRACPPPPRSLQRARTGFTRKAQWIPPDGPARPRGNPADHCKGNDWTARFPLVAEAVNHLKVRSCLIDGAVVCCDEKGGAAFQLLRHRRNEPRAFLHTFDLLELNGADICEGWIVCRDWAGCLTTRARCHIPHRTDRNDRRADATPRSYRG
jgi:hypothetical protein